MSMHDPREVNDISQIESLLRRGGNGLIAIDGCALAGKTALMNDLASRLKCPAIDLDPYLERERGEFSNALRLTELASAIEQACRQSPVVLVAGVCMREVLDRLGIAAARHVYVQRNSTMGIPCDLDILDLEDGRQIIDTSLFGELDREVAAYHDRYHPRRNADVVYVRTGKD